MGYPGLTFQKLAVNIFDLSTPVEQTDTIQSALFAAIRAYLHYCNYLLLTVCNVRI